MKFSRRKRLSTPLGVTAEYCWLRLATVKKSTFLLNCFLLAFSFMQLANKLLEVLETNRKGKRISGFAGLTIASG
jgi:hypothetical protein